VAALAGGTRERDVGERAIGRRGVAAVMATGLLLAGTATAAHAGVEDNKTYTVDIDGTVGTAGDVWAGDADATITIRIRNTSLHQSLGSVNVTVPAPLVLLPSAADAEPGGPVLELRSLAIAPGATTTVTVAVDVRTCAPATPAAFAVSAKQSNKFNGQGNDFYLSASADRQVNVTGTCSLAFVGQPQDAEKNTAITTVDFTPTAAPVTVEVRDAGGTGRATHSTASITLAGFRGTTAQALGGTTSANAVAGLASFGPGPTAPVSSSDYTLRAQSAGLVTSAASARFAIVDDRAACPAQAACEQASSAANGSTVSASFGPGSTTTNLLLSIGAADAPNFSCAGYPRTAGLEVSQFTFSDDAGGDRVGTMTATIPNAWRHLDSYKVCWAAPYAFKTESGAPAAIQPGVFKPGTTTPLRVGLLPDCPHHSYGAKGTPCIESRSFDKKTKTLALTVRATGDDPWRY
jgi:hypothetical protein